MSGDSELELAFVCVLRGDLVRASWLLYLAATCASEE